MKRRIFQSMPGALLIAALLLFVAFHFLPATNGSFKEPGWAIWHNLWDAILNPGWMLHRADEGIAIASFLMFSLLIVISPFLGGVLVKSRLVWVSTVLFSGLSGVGFWLVLGREITNPGVGLGCLVSANTLNFIGLILSGMMREPAEALVVGDG